MKKVIALTLVMIFSISLVACSGKNDTPSNNDSITTLASQSNDDNSVETQLVTDDTPSSDTSSLDANADTNAGITVNVGDIIQFGRSDWRVLEVQDGKALILREEVLEGQMKYHSESNVAVTWETCSLREYLNGEFFDRTFNDDEKMQILDTSISNQANQWFDTSGGNDTIDKIFVLSVEEVVKYFGDSGQFANRPDNAWVIDDQYNDARLPAGRTLEPFLWLRTPGSTEYYPAFIFFDGTIDFRNPLSAEGDVRPAMWVNL